MKVLLILVDGMRPDALSEIDECRDFIKNAAYTMHAETVMPSVTLPCHMSLFHSVDPSRHGTTTNVYAPQVRPINGLCEVLCRSGKKSAFFYNWEQLRDLTRPDSLTFSFFCKGGDMGYEEANDAVTDAAIECLKKNNIDFTFLYLGYTDEAGHRYGWMSDAYMESMKKSWQSIKKIADSLDDEYTIIVTADHGGHDRMHGTDLPEDMTIPLIIKSSTSVNTVIPDGVSIKDIAPTVTKLLGVDSDAEWEGKSLL